MNIDKSLVIRRMQDAVDQVHGSEHIKNKIACCLFDPVKQDVYTVHVNHRPLALKNAYTPDIRIGNSSQFIHAETACIFDFESSVEGTAICITDPFCPNCAKAIAESGIRHVYIDHKGLDKDFAKRRGADFESLSLLIMEKAGIKVSIVYRKEDRIEPLLDPKIETRIGSAAGIEFFDIADELSIADMVHSFRMRQAHTAWATARIKEKEGKTTGILVFEGLPPGLTPHDYTEKRGEVAKYRLPVDPLNRLYFYIKRKGLTLMDNHVGCNLFPSSRALVNSTGMNVQKLTIGESTPDHDSDGHNAASILEKSSILTIERLY